MITDTKILDITADVKWIGVMDPDIRTFDVVMETEFGTTYNSYFINARKKTIIEATKEKFWDIYLAKIKQVCDPAEIELILVNHTEPDHAGNIKNLLKIAPKAKIAGSGNAIRYLADIMNMDFPHIILKDGDILDLGDKKLRFISAPNLHWPDTGYTYLEEDKVLFTCDSFGAHFCHPEMYSSKVGNYDDAFKYYFDVILKPFSKFMLKAIEKIRPLEIKAICTGHGPLLIEDWKRYVDLSEKYSQQYLELPGKEHALVAYVSAYGKTGMIAEAIAEGVRETGVEADLCDIEKMPASELGDKISQASAIIVGTPTINQNILPPIYTLFALCTPLRDKGKLAGCFGSYGWSGEAAKQLESGLINLKFSFVPGGIFCKFTPSEDELLNAKKWGTDFGKKMIENSFASKK
jgi:NADH oxidase (H2O-forming)